MEGELCRGLPAFPADPHKETGAREMTQSDQPSVLDMTYQATVPWSRSHCKIPFLLQSFGEQLCGPPPRLLNLIICGEGQSLAAGQGSPSRRRRLQGDCPCKTKRNWEPWSQFRGFTWGKPTQCRSCPENTEAEESTVSRARSNPALKYQLGKKTKRDGFGLKRTHLFSRSIYLFIN